MYHGQLTPASMRILFDALLLVSQAADILSALDDKCVGTSLKSLLMAANSFWSVLVAALRWRLEENTEYQKPPRSKCHKGVPLDDVKELQVRVKLDHPVLQQRHWHRLLTDMKKADAPTQSQPPKKLPEDIGLDQSRMLVIQAALLCTSFLLHAADTSTDLHDITSTYLDFPRHECEKDMCIDIRTITRVMLLVAHRWHGEGQESVM
nr:hypothetical protein [Ulva partita]